MSLFERFGREEKPRRRTPTHIPLNFGYDAWPDKITLIYIRDRLCWLHGESENSLLIQRLNDIIHRTDSDANSTLGF